MARQWVHQYPRGAQLPLKDFGNPLTKMSLLRAQSPKYLLNPSGSDQIHLSFFLAQSGKTQLLKTLLLVPSPQIWCMFDYSTQ